MRRNAQFKRALKTLHGYFEVASVVGDLVNEVTRNAIEQLEKEAKKKCLIIQKLRRSPKFEIKPSCYKLNPVLDAVEENVFKSKGMRLDLSHERALDFPSSELQEILDTMITLYPDDTLSDDDDEEEVPLDVWDPLTATGDLESDY